MQFVEPIRNPKHITQIKNQLRWSWEIRNLLLFELWINSALRVSDLLSIQSHHLYKENWDIAESFTIKERKTWKKSKIAITKNVKKTLLLYKDKYQQIIQEPWKYIFFTTRSLPYCTKPLTRKMAWFLINKRCKEYCNLKWSYWGHTLRKTRWFQARKNNIPIELIQHRLNHSSTTITKRYLGITDDELERVCRELDL